jgi:uncharacterized repeat protein (TIGR03803 family)
MIGNSAVGISSSKSLRSKSLTESLRSRNRKTASGNFVLAARFCLLAILMTGLYTGRAHAQLTEMYAFQYNANTASNHPDGSSPVAELIQGADGNYYTTTTAGGSGACAVTGASERPGCGTIVKITPAGVLRVFYSFPYDATTNAAPNGIDPAAGLLQGPDGNFYGVSSLGGSTAAGCQIDDIFGCGTIFKISPHGTFTLLHSFCGGTGCNGGAMDGAIPLGRLVYDNGYYYGTTQQGSYYDGVYNSGTIFRISPAGAYEIVHNFTGCCGTGDGENPAAGLTLASNGELYGTTRWGGTGNNGSIFKMNSAGTVTILHSFVENDPNGSQPLGALIQASDGNLYGTCYASGAGANGTVFRISMAGAFEKIYDFVGGTGNVGYLTHAGVIQASDGNLYGTAVGGGGDDLGSIYQLTLGGVATLEGSFTADTGWSPVGALVQGSDGRLYVTTENDGGANSSGVQDDGSIAVLNAGLPVPKPAIARFSPPSGAVGKEVIISEGPYIGATAVTFNGTSATFEVKGSGFIAATVPTGATTGPISVTTPGGRTVSTKIFTVLP